MLREEHPERYADGQLRTLQRRVEAWRAAHGPDQEVVLGQRHRAGEAAQTDFTTTAELGVTIAGQAFVHLLCVLVLPYSNWQWATVCLSESLAALRRGVQRALFQLGRVPEHHQTVGEELAAMRPLDVSRLPEFVEDTAVVSEWSTIRISKNAYSVPSRLIGEALRVHLYEDRLEAYFGDQLELACERLRGRNGHRIDYRHVIWSLVRKPGGFARCVYREELFPSVVFRRAYDAIQAPHRGTSGDLEYLHLAASTMQTDVEPALVGLLAEGEPITADSVKELVGRAAAPAIPELASPAVDLHAYDLLLAEVAA